MKGFVAAGRLELEVSACSWYNAWSQVSDLVVVEVRTSLIRNSTVRLHLGSKRSPSFSYR
jgi:hypothetical protein